jgi:hypothetical protein
MLAGLLDGNANVVFERYRAARPDDSHASLFLLIALLDEWAYMRVYRSDSLCNRAIDRWLHIRTITAPTPHSELRRRWNSSTTSLVTPASPPACTPGGGAASRGS